MSSPTLSTIENDIFSSDDPQDCPISCIFSQLIEPEHGQVSPDFLEYQDTEAANTTSNQEGEGMEADGIGMEVGAAHQSLPQPTSLVSVMTVSDVSDVLCAHNCPAEYCHNHSVFIPPPTSKQIAHNILQHAQEVHEAGIGPIVGYSISNDDSDKENDSNATAIPPQPQG